MQKQATLHEMEDLYPQALRNFLAKGVENEILNPELLEMDIEKLGKAIHATRDADFTYLGLQTLYDRYFIHDTEVRYELPQVFFMRVSMGLALREDKREERAIEFYNLLSSFDYMSSTPTLFNSGTKHSQLSSCYLTTVPDDLHGIYGAIQDNAMLSKWAGGLGNDWTPVRGLGSQIKGTNGKSQGVVPFLKVVNDTAVAVNQGGKRKGAVCSYLETWHVDIEEFVELRKNTGDDRRRTHDMNTANWVPDLFLKRVSEDKKWTLFTPSDTPDLHDLYGLAFEKRYEEYEAQTQTGEIEFFKEVEAKELWKKMLSMVFETGHPWITFKDVCNLRSPQQHTGVVHSSNLCTEITLNTSQDEIAVCNLGSVNLTHHIKDGKMDEAKLEKTINTAIRMLDNVIDINFYAVKAAETSNMKHRPIGLGIMGFHDALYMLKTPYASQEAVEFADRSMEMVSYYAIKASSDLAKERGAYQSYEGSLWSQGVLPIDSIKLLKESRGEEYLDVDESTTMDWDGLRATVKEQGIRNSNVMAIAPTATIANITGVSQSIEPTYQNLYVKSNLSGEFTVTNIPMVENLKELGLWDSVMINDLKYYDGSVKGISRIPEDVKELYATAFDIEPRWLIDAASRRQKWIDQSQSLNLYIDEPNGKKLDIMYRMAWLRGLKTTYYLRSRSATTTEKSTISTGELNAVAATAQPEVQPQAQTTAPSACSILDPDCDACQ
jgi:ribonucleoside-diphosphate reductase alpha chain